MHVYTGMEKDCHSTHVVLGLSEQQCELMLGLAHPCASKQLYSGGIWGRKMTSDKSEGSLEMCGLLSQCVCIGLRITTSRPRDARP